MLHLKSAQLSGYKSIKQAEVEFKSGLNIIIGKNAVGKTNFLSFLYKLFLFDYRDIYEEFDSKLLIQNDVLTEIKASRQKPEIGKPIKDLMNFSPILQIVKREDEEIHFGSEDETLEEGLNYLHKALDLTPIIVRHGIQGGPLLYDSPFALKTDLATEVFRYTRDSSLPFFTKCLITSLYRFSAASDQKSPEHLTEFLVKGSEMVIELVRSSIAEITPVSNVRLSSRFLVVPSEEQGGCFDVSNLFLEYNVDGVWRLFPQLSSGTQRMIFLIADLVIGGSFSFTANSIEANRINEGSQIILIEEPELGIHPHQLHKLMQLIKEQSEKKQIILTTHSPQVLDILGADELDRIVIAKHERTKGTTFHHLSDAQIKKAKNYMDETGFLSDYWRFSDLEE